jgi:hypothetical protein
MGTDLGELIVISLIMLLLALFAPLLGAVLALYLVWHGNRYGPVARRNVAIFCAALAIFNLFAPTVLLPHLIA